MIAEVITGAMVVWITIIVIVGICLLIEHVTGKEIL